MTVLYYAQEGASQAEEKALSEPAQGFFLFCSVQIHRAISHAFIGINEEAWLASTPFPEIFNISLIVRGGFSPCIGRSFSLGNFSSGTQRTAIGTQSKVCYQTKVEIRYNF